MDARQQRAEELLATGRIDRQGHIFFVPSQSGKPRYSVIFDDADVPSCSCLDFEERAKPCKHIIAVQMLLERQRTGQPMPAPVELPPPPKRKTYKQDWVNYNLAQTNEKGHFQDLLADLCSRIPEPAREGRGRKPIPLADAIFAAVFKVYSLFSARRFACDLEDAAKRGLIDHAPHFNIVLKTLDSPETTPILFDLIRQSALPLRTVEQDFAVDSSGFMTSRFIRWFDVKYGTTKQSHEWVKVHLISGVKTNIVAAVEILDQRAGDAPRLPSLVQETRKGFTIRDVSADAAYASNDNFEAVADAGGTLYAQFKSNATGGIGGVYEKMFHLFSMNREEYLQHYHKRSNVESTFSMMKRKHGDSLRSKTDTAMKNEALAKVLCHNICCLISAWYELGIEPLFVGKPGEEERARNVLRFPG